MILLRIWKRYWILIVTLFVASALAMGSIYKLYQPPPSLPVYTPNMLDASLVDPSVQYVRKYHKIPDFKLINQNGDTITQADYEDKIYVADFFYTTCPSFCSELTASFQRVQQVIKEDEEVKLLSHSVTPNIDSVARLKEYAVKHEVDDHKWNLVTGPKKEIYELARKAYCVVQEDGDGGEYDMIHTENFVLIDKKKRIRGFYDGTNDEEVDQLLEDIKTLKEIEKLQKENKSKL